MKAGRRKGKGLEGVGGKRAYKAYVVVAVVDKVVGRHTCYTTRLRARLLCLTFTLLKRNFPKTSGLPNPDLTPKKTNHEC